MIKKSTFRRMFQRVDDWCKVDTITFKEWVCEMQGEIIVADAVILTLQG